MKLNWIEEQKQLNGLNANHMRLKVMARTVEEEQKMFHEVITRLWKFSKNLIDCDLDSDAVWEKAVNQVQEEFNKTESDYQDFAAEIFNAVLRQANNIRKERNKEC